MQKKRLAILEACDYKLPVLMDELDALDTLFLLEDDLTADVFGAKHQQ